MSSMPWGTLEASSRAGTSLVNSQGPASTTLLNAITLTRDVTLALVNLGRTLELVTTETLSSIFSTGDRETLIATVSCAFCGCNVFVSNISKFHTGKDPVYAIAVAS